MKIPTESCDVIVIGGGSAAFEAAIAAHEHGAEKIIMLEKAPEAEYGGNARYSGTGFRFWHAGLKEIREFVPGLDGDYINSLQISPYTNEEFSSDLERMTLGRMDDGLARTLVEQSNAAVHWMKDIGIVWELLKEHAKIGNKRYFERGIAIHVAGGGVGQLEQWRRIAEARNIELRFSCPVSAIHGNMHRVEGVRVCTEEREYDLAAGAVIACAGGFQANAEMRARYLAGNADL
ncbi:MAG TPA: FAD-dependent oxidoreductase, partial [Micropepsaceae bacterium]|nr:FAD-dependent oxidoreductase [Micropepsaceae bacterium]